MWLSNLISTPKIINICYRDNGGGLSQDADVIAKLLKGAGFLVLYNGTFFKVTGLVRFKNIYSKFINLLVNVLPSYFKPMEVNIHLEIILEKNINLAKKNIMVANLEWLREDSYSLLSKIDLFLCKTKHAENFFRLKQLPVKYVSFSSISPYNKKYKQKPNTVVHIAGKSEHKGSLTLARIWSKHPEWPKLTMLTVFKEHFYLLKEFKTENIDVRGGHLKREDLQRIQNEHEIHLCLSEAEGFGHYICEALSCEAIVVTTDGYPMNELVLPDRGILVKVRTNMPMRHSRRFIFDTDDFEMKMDILFRMKDVEKNRIKSNARKWFIENDAAFSIDFIAAVNNLLDKD